MRRTLDLQHAVDGHCPASWVQNVNSNEFYIRSSFKHATTRGVCDELVPIDTETLECLVLEY